MGHSDIHASGWAEGCEELKAGQWSECNTSGGLSAHHSVIRCRLFFSKLSTLALNWSVFSMDPWWAPTSFNTSAHTDKDEAVILCCASPQGYLPSEDAEKHGRIHVFLLLQCFNKMKPHLPGRLKAVRSIRFSSGSYLLQIRSDDFPIVGCNSRYKEMDGNLSSVDHKFLAHKRHKLSYLRVVIFKFWKTHIFPDAHIESEDPFVKLATFLICILVPTNTICKFPVFGLLHLRLDGYTCMWYIW